MALAAHLVDHGGVDLFPEDPALVRSVRVVAGGAASLFHGVVEVLLPEGRGVRLVAVGA